MTFCEGGGHSASNLIQDGHFRSKDEFHEFDQLRYFNILDIPLEL